MLRVVEYEQHVERLQTGHERGQLMVSARHRQLERPRHHGADERGLGDRREIDPGRPVALCVTPGVRRGERERGLADAARAEHRDVTMLGEQVIERDKVVVATEQSRRRAGRREGFRAGRFGDNGCWRVSRVRY